MDDQKNEKDQNHYTLRDRVLSLANEWERRTDAVAITYQDPAQRARATALPRAWIAQLREVVETDDIAGRVTSTDAVKHPEFTKFRDERLKDPAVRAAYEEAKARRDKGAICDVAGCDGCDEERA